MTEQNTCLNQLKINLCTKLTRCSTKEGLRTNLIKKCRDRGFVMSQEAALGCCHILLVPTTWKLLPGTSTNNSFLASVLLYSLSFSYTRFTPTHRVKL